MNWNKIVLAGGVGGIVVTLVDWLLHGVVMRATYERYPDVFTQEESGIYWFFIIGICIGIAAAIFFAKSRSCWADGVKGGVVFGALLGLVSFFPHFYSPLVIDGFPYFLAWCQGGITFIGAVVLGAVLGLLYK